MVFIRKRVMLLWSAKGSYSGIYYFILLFIYYFILQIYDITPRNLVRVRAFWKSADPEKYAGLRQYIKKNPDSYITIRILSRAEDGAQTRDPQLGRLMLYQLSYFRNFSGQRWIRTTEGVSQQIYSLPHLATLVFALFAFE